MVRQDAAALAKRRDFRLSTVDYRLSYMTPVHTLVGGILGLIAAAGVGLGITRLVADIPSRWQLSLSLVIGVAIVDYGVMLALFLGGGVAAVKWLGVGATAMGAYLLWRHRKHLSLAPGLRATRTADRWCMAVVAGAVTINLLIAVAPSTKIDELVYHMLIPKWVMEDNGLCAYHWPFAAAIYPQIGYQLGLSAAYAAGFPEAGNVISWGLGTALILLVAGLARDLVGSTTAGWMTGAVAAVGLYPAVWHVASGPHAQGDLAFVVASALCLFPEGGEIKPERRLLLVCVAAYAAAATKISLLPLCAIITVLAVLRVAPHAGGKKSLAIALAVWGVLYGPIVLWATLRSGSPFGLATASLFHSTYFSPETVARYINWQAVYKTGWIPLLTWLAPSVSIGVPAAFAILAYAALRREEVVFKIVLGLVLTQALLIAWLLPQQFRFLGGLQYVVLILGAWVFWPSAPGLRLAARWWLVLAGLCLPWLALQVYYAAPLLKVVSGAESRGDFLRKYVGFTEDFRALDRILPANAVLYVVDSRLPVYYAPRPVIFTLEDLRGRAPLYRFNGGNDDSVDQDLLSCTETVYKNPDAITVVYRTPGRAAEHGPLKVESCHTIPADRPVRNGLAYR